MRSWPTAPTPPNSPGRRRLEDATARRIRRYAALSSGACAVSRARGGRNRTAGSQSCFGGSAATTSTPSPTRRANNSGASCSSAPKARSALFERIELDLSADPAAGRVLGVCHFERFARRHGDEPPHRRLLLEPTAVELVDRTMIGLARDIPIYRVMVERFVQGRPRRDPGLVEFASDDADERQSPASAPIERADGRSRRLSTATHVGVGSDRSGAAERHRGGPAGRAQHHDVDEERRKSRCRSSRTAPCRSSISREYTDAAQRDLRGGTASRGRGTPTPRWDACTCDPCSTC